MDKISSSTLYLTAWRVKDSLQAGLRQEWLSGEGDGVKFELLCGAGLGSPWLILAVDVTNEDGTTDHRQEVVDIRPLAEAWVKHVVAEGRTEGLTQ